MRVEARPNGLILDVPDKATVAHVPTAAADADDVTGRGDEASGNKAYSDVAGTAGVAKERSIAEGRVKVAGIVGPGAESTKGRVTGAVDVVYKGSRSNSRAPVAGVL